MKLTLVNGINGRMEYCLREMSAHIGSGERLVLVVPDQASYSSERTAVEYFGGTGLNGVEVLTFNRMADRYLKPRGETRLTPAGKSMLLYRAIRNVSAACRKENRENIFLASMGKRGFSAGITSVISEFRRYGVTPEELYKTALALQDEALSKKMTSLYDIYSEYSSLIDGRFSDSDDDLLLLSEDLEDGEFSGARVWISGFSEFSPGHMRVISALIKTAECVTAVLPMPDGDIPRDSIYAQTKKTYNDLIELASRLKCGFSALSLPAVDMSSREESLKFLRENWDRRGLIRFAKSPAIEITASTDPYSEFDSTAEKITALVMFEDYSYSDIAVICGDLDSVRHIAESVFADYGIPYFSDYKISLAEHPAVLPITAVFDIIKNNYSFDSVFRYLRSGYVFMKDDDGNVTRINDEDVDLLENYVLKRGIRGASAWCGDRHWDIGFERVFDAAAKDSEKNVHPDESDDGDENFYDDLRRRLIAPVEKLRLALKGRHTIPDAAARLYDFIGDINLYEGIRAEIHRLEDEEKITEAARLARIWELLLEVLDQAAATDDSSEVTAEEFRDYIEAGFSSCEISIIPPGIDTVTLASPERGLVSEVKAVFVLGTNFGVIPPAASDEGILSDRDRAEAALLGLQLAPDTVMGAQQIYSTLMRSVMCAKERVYFMYTASDGNGGELEPSPLISDILNMFPKTRTLTDKTTYLPVSAPKATVHKLLINHEKRGAIWESAADWYRENGYTEYIALIDEARRFGSGRAHIEDIESYQKLYPLRKYSISGLELFGKCPFRYFLSRGIKARPREEWKISGADFGTLAHTVIERFCRTVDADSDTVEKRRKNWESLTDKNADELLDSVIAEAAEKTLSSIYRDEKKVSYIIDKVKRILARTVGIVRMSITQGRYVPAAYEYKYDMDMGNGISMQGFIDRIDMYEHDGSADFRVLDYKTGSNNSCDPLDIFNRLSLQLAVYALAAEYSYMHDGDFPLKELESADAVTRGVFYSVLRNDYKATSKTDDKSRAADAKASLRLEGMIFADSDGDETDTGAILDMDPSVANGGESEFLPVKINKTDKRPSKNNSSVSTRRHINMLKEWVSAVIEDADADIRNGVIDACPYEKKDADACGDYCDYKELCIFKRGDMRARRLETDAEKAWEIIKDNYDRRRIYKNQSRGTGHDIFAQSEAEDNDDQK